MKIHAILHYSDVWDSWECYTHIPPTDALVFGTGKSEEEAKRDFLRSLKEAADTLADIGIIAEWAEKIDVEYKQI